MPKFMGGFSNSKSWSNQARQPKCGPGCSRGMTLMEAAAEQNKKNKDDLKSAQQRLAKAQDREDWSAVKKIAKEITRIKARR